ncbi:hypothetical protein Tco_1440181 [Tanacetum coccineum]
MPRIIPPRIFKKKSVRKKRKKRVAKAMKKTKRLELTSNNAGGSIKTILEKLLYQRFTDVHPLEQRESYVTTENCPATLNPKGDNQELWNLTLKGDDIEAYITFVGFPERSKETSLLQRPANLHEAINMARVELVEPIIQGRAAKIGKALKEWEDNQ